MNTSFQRRIAQAFMLSIGWVCSTHANVRQQQAVPPTQSSSPVQTIEPTSFTADRSVEEVARFNCLPGLERFLPGTYYYCVGTRDVALGKNDRARSMLELAAAWGSKQAEFLLGVGYYKGDLQPLDRARGLAWLGLASERKYPAYLAIFTSAWKQATPQEHARAQRLWRSMLPTYGDEHAARRAAARFKHEHDALLDGRETNGQQICIFGLTSGQIAPIPIDSGLSGNSSACDGGDISAVFVAKRLDVYADQLLEGWEGHVTVGNLQAVPASSK
jgi:hypothetical protein